MVTTKRLAKIRKDTTRTIRQGKHWIQLLESELKELPNGIWICINVKTGEYVTGKTMSDAGDAFEKKFGAKQQAYLHPIGDEIHA